MEFTKYTSITNSYSTKFIDKIVIEGLARKEQMYSVTEKIHGANFAAYVSGGLTKFASRNQILGSTSGFYDLSSISNELKNKFVLLNKENEYIFYGELFGGGYPGIKTQSKIIQKGIWYSPKNEFFIFDVVKNGELLDFDSIVKLCESIYIPYVPELFRGTLQQCLEFDIKFNSIIPNLLDLPEITDNICEGVVIKPVEPLFLSNCTRVILKSKNEAFKEKTKSIAPLSENIQEKIDEALTYVTQQRLDNLLGQLDIDFSDKKNIPILFKLMFEDIIKEMEENTLEKADIKIVNKAMSASIRKLVLPLF